ncbi:hypothetical protein TUM18999_44220 [Pseudomonas tohonis]|uniref:Uncharacterized protein n=1 Tax=Pseudomonas tohonis TaxID=2725477 RepID=A0A6J4ECU2_9PSED|nr:MULTISPECIES: hypothetical protein [Pseudomonas]BBP84751.1 hypothetical protein PHLH8_43930 [Pseudomonas sp. Pc102]BCG26231.1 hypothetical protein TUM18999_44220 [Pseudomonas tohonis]GJN51036.1 hypothetical protein TUM20286_07880 [Pseudomonas tohonis]
MDTCQSISAAELKNLVHQQLHDCSPAQQVVFAACRVPFTAHPRLRYGELEQVLVVAELPGGFLFFEETNEAFGLGVVDEHGVLHCQGHHPLALNLALARAGF